MPAAPALGYLVHVQCAAAVYTSVTMNETLAPFSKTDPPSRVVTAKWRGCGQMVTSVNAKKLGQRCAVAALVAGLWFSASSISQVAAQPDSLQNVSSNSALQPAIDEAAEVRQALMVFIRSMAKGDAKTVWMYASEEDQAAFESEDAVLTAFKDAFPALTTAKELRFDIVREEGDTPFSSLTFKDEFGHNYQAEIGLWLDDAGDWKVVSCDVNAVTERVASL